MRIREDGNRVIVAGGGVAGAASAIGFRRIGAEVTVYEAYEDPAGPVGSFVSLSANGLRGLDTLGCLDRVRDAGFALPLQRMWASNGRLLGEVARGRLSADPMYSITLWRGRLVEELRKEAVRLGARVVTGERLVDAERLEAGGVRAAFAGGRTDEADLLVGADGIRSATRRILDPGAAEPSYGGYYTVPGISAGGGADLAPGTFNLTFSRAGAFIAIPVPDGTVWWAAQVAAPDKPDAGIGLDALARLYRYEEQPSAVLREARELHRPTAHHLLEDVRVWQRAPMVLVGDAVHPVGAGQGASMAIEDPAVLAHAVMSAASLPEALETYERGRRGRTAKLMKMAGANRESKTAGPVARRVQNAVMPLVLRFLYERSTSWLYTHELEPLPRVSGRAG
ncbi:FAD-dependent oxidoreductase [Actinomadura sp. SCN-SB]|uniref:FAD-dependent oxidoreductase n=1 Tax=Actinomadura sp. SCN-SB TaxID=3373092 RepID=UPI0037534132